MLQKEMELKGTCTPRAVAFAYGQAIFASSSELAFLNMQAKKCGYPEASGFLYTCSITSYFL